LGVGPNDPDSLPRDLAGYVICSRVRFQEIYDGVTRELPPVNGAGGAARELFLSVVLGDDLTPPANDGQAFTRAFAGARAEGWLKLLVGRCLESTVLDRKALDLMKPAQPKKKTKTKTVLQAALDIAEGYTDPNAYASGLLRMVPKICLVKARLKGGRSTQGTGFLIGAQSVLTAWHVIEPLLDPNTRVPVPDSHKQLSVEFDYVDPLVGQSARANVRSYEVVEDWLLEHSPCHDSEQLSTKGMSSTLLKEAGIDADHLDFAVLRLKGSPGRDRGVVVLPSAGAALREGEQTKLLVFQHPNQFPQRFASGTFIGFFGGGEPPARLRHRANTEPGSSGGLCVNADFESVGLHQATVVDASGTAIANQAIPTALIAARLARAFQIDPILDPMWSLKDTKEPVLGREDFQKSVWRLVRGEKRVIAVRGQRRMGLTFSGRILRSMLPTADTLVVEISADEIGRDAAKLAKLLLERCGGKLPDGESFPAESAAGTTANAWLRDQMLPDLARRVQGAAAGKPVWIVLEHLDRHDVPEDKARELLLALMGAATDAPFMRFLLLGVKNTLPGVPADFIEDDVLTWPVTADIDAYIQRRCTANNVLMDTDERARWVTTVMNAARKDQADQWQKAVDFLVENVHPITAKKGNG